MISGAGGSPAAVRMVRPSQLPPVVTPQWAVSASVAVASTPASDRTRATSSAVQT